MLLLGSSNNIDGSNNIFRKRAAFLNFLRRSNFLRVKSVHNLKVYALLFTLLAIALSLVNYFVTSRELHEGGQRYLLIVSNDRLIACEQTILSKLQELEALNRGLLLPLASSSNNGINSSNTNNTSNTNTNNTSNTNNNSTAYATSNSNNYTATSNNNDSVNALFLRRRQEMSVALIEIEKLQNDLQLTHLSMSSEQSKVGSSRSVQIQFYS